MVRRHITWCFALILLGPSLARAQARLGAPIASDSAPIVPPPAADAGVSIFPMAEGKVQPAPGDPAKEQPPDKMSLLEQKLDAISKNLTVTTADPSIKLVLGGAVIADFIYNSARPVSPGTPFFLTPGPFDGFRQSTFDASARQTTLFAMIMGPEVCGFQSSGQVAGVLYSSSLIEDLWGFLPIEAYAQLKNEDWRFAAGLQMDIFNPLNPMVLPFSLLGASGNTGAFRGQLRVERYLHPSGDSDITLTAGISDPVPTTVNNSFRVNEDNGWPNVETRAAWAFGPMIGEGLAAKRPFEVGLSGVVGQMRTTVPATTQVVADVWGLGADLRWAIDQRFGFQGEVFVGQTLGTYMGSILQNINSATFHGLHSAGGWFEVYYYICPETLHTHVGYGIDDPLDSDLAPGQPVRNETVFANVIWDPSKHFRVALEVTYRKTAYTLVSNNDGVGIQGQVQLKF
ncbi:MAG TPA: hypothetical protein VKE98_05695 [Gemmataceae bacterium]|nr:hypothetical protein [Gemmataceae bacterium]